MEIIMARPKKSTESIQETKPSAVLQAGFNPINPMPTAKLPEVPKIINVYAVR